MKTSPVKEAYQPTEGEIREKAMELYIQSGYVADRDLDNWLEAEAWLRANHPTVRGEPASNGNRRGSRQAVARIVD